MTGGDGKWFSYKINKNPFKKLISRLKKKSTGSPPPCTCGALARANDRLMVDMRDADAADEEEFLRVCQEELAEWKPHTQVDYIHFLVPDLTNIIASPHYWAKMDRYEAENQLENKPEGSFLLRDSAQDEYIFSVSFRRYGRSLHARIEESDHFFSFDCHDPGVYRSQTIPQLLQHYKDPTSCMFFEPLLYCPVNRTNPFSLQQIARANICDRLKSYSSIDKLELPRSMKLFLKEYHYKHKIRTRTLE